jgi:hypothetical protein
MPFGHQKTVGQTDQGGNAEGLNQRQSDRITGFGLHHDHGSQRQYRADRHVDRAN